MKQITAIRRKNSKKSASFMLLLSFDFSNSHIHCWPHLSKIQWSRRFCSFRRNSCICMQKLERWMKTWYSAAKVIIPTARPTENNLFDYTDVKSIFGNSIPYTTVSERRTTSDDDVGKMSSVAAKYIYFRAVGCASSTSLWLYKFDKTDRKQQRKNGVLWKGNYD